MWIFMHNVNNTVKTALLRKCNGKDPSWILQRRSLTFPDLTFQTEWGWPFCVCVWDLSNLSSLLSLAEAWWVKYQFHPESNHEFTYSWRFVVSQSLSRVWLNVWAACPELHSLLYHVVNLVWDVLLMCYMKQHLCCEVVHLTHKTIKTWFSLFNSHLNVFHDILLQTDAEILPETHSSNKRSYFWDGVVFFCVTKNKILYIYLHHNNLTVQLLVTLQMNNLKD